MSRRMTTFDVFVGNLPSDANEKNVGKLFVSYGEIQGIFVKDTKTPNVKNAKIAFIKFLCEPDAERAVSEMNGVEVEGRPITVKRAEPFSKKKGEDGDRTSTGKPKYNESDKSGLHHQPRNSDVTGEKETAMVTHVESPVTLWLQIVTEENTQRIFHITEQLTALCPTARKLASQPDPNKVYACNFSEDQMWYRCLVRQTLGTDKYKIQYIDYGNTEEVSVGSLVEIPASVSSSKGLAQKVVLHNTRAKDLSDKQGIQHLKMLTDNQMIQLIRTRTLTDGTGHFGHILVNGQSVAEAMVQAGFAVKRPVLGGKNPPTMGQVGAGGDTPLASQMAFLASTTDRSPGQAPVSAPHPAEQLFIPPLMQADNSKEKELLTELTKKRRELERMRNEKDSAKMEVEYMRSKLKALQEEFSAEAAKMSEDTLSKRISSVIALACKVRQLREQFPTNKTCILEEAIALSQSADRVDNSSVISLQAVGSTLTTYKAAQKEISVCKDQSELPSLIESRDEGRRDLFEKLTVCVEELGKMPLATRTKEVEETELKIQRTYASYMKFHVHDCPSIENLMAGFQTWKNKKDGEFADVRTATDFSEGAVQAVLQQVRELMSVDQPGVAAKSDVDIDSVMKTYAHALQREVNATDLERSKDSSLVATVIASVRRELRSEYNMLQNFNQLKTEFTTLWTQIKPWLNETPSFTGLQENRKLLRSLRSKLRHKLADKQDIEESGSESELESIKNEEEEIRAQLQAALVQSDALVVQLSELVEQSFPELKLQYQDLGVEAHLQYGGLVKGNREIDHYCLLPGYRPNLYQSKFDGKPVIIQELHIGDSEHCSKEDFMKQVLTYSKETQAIQAVFFSKNERLAYIQFQAVEGELLETLVTKRTLTPQEIQHICREVVMAVTSLHSWGCIHGEVTPQAVVVTENMGTVSLLPPDFSRTVTDRSLKRYTTENGLTFNLQEQIPSSNPEVVGASSELYNVALLIFWLHSLDTQVAILPNGFPDTRAVRLDASLMRMCEALLSGNNRMRIAAAQILQLEYFSKTIQCPPTPPVVVTPPPAPQPQPAPVMPEVTEVTEVQTVQPDAPNSCSAAGPKGEMEIGVFRVEDLLGSEEIALPEDVLNSGDTDDSWTTKSSTTTADSNSRTDSPLEGAQEGSKMGDTSETDPQQTVIEAETPSGEATLISGNSSDFGESSVPVETQSQSGGDIFSQAGNSPFLGEEQASAPTAVTMAAVSHALAEQEDIVKGKVNCNGNSSDQGHQGDLSDTEDIAEHVELGDKPMITMEETLPGSFDVPSLLTSLRETLSKQDHAKTSQQSC